MWSFLPRMGNELAAASRRRKRSASRKGPLAVSKFAVILPAAGKSSRFRDPHYKKPFAPLDGRALWLHSAERFMQRDDVVQVLIVVAADDRELFLSRFGANVAILGIEVVNGGAERMDSVHRALQKVRDDVDFVAVHDAARPCLANEWIDRVFSAAEKTGAAILGMPVTSTLKRVAGDTIRETVARDDLWEAQTPQVFRRQLLLDAYRQHGDTLCTDEAQLVERAGHPLSIVRGSPINLKVTTKDDLKLASAALKAMPQPKSLGPLHPFAEDRFG
jgi:2-C-methyl-D-erythritol 4-phosphate cytidylyltransferase